MNALQLILRNALVHARNVMKLTDETFNAVKDAITTLNSKDYVDLRMGEDVAIMTPNVTYAMGKLSVDPSSPTPGIVTFQTAGYALNVVLNEVLVFGTGFTFQIQKNYYDPATRVPLNPPSKLFASTQLPLESDNFTVIVTIVPGGDLSRVLMLLDMPD